jgi:hypothetical protein
VTLYKLSRGIPLAVSEPRYSHDISLCDLFSFVGFKRKPKGEEFDPRKDLQGRVEKLLGSPTSEIMRRAREH